MHIEADLPDVLRDELAAMALLSDAALWSIARSTARAERIALHDVLLDRQRDGTLSAEERSTLSQLRDEAEALALRKAHAFLLLKARGQQIPPLDSLPTAAGV